MGTNRRPKEGKRVKTKSSGLGLMDLQKEKHAVWVGPESLAIRLVSLVAIPPKQQERRRVIHPPLASLLRVTFRNQHIMRQPAEAPHQQLEVQRDVGIVSVGSGHSPNAVFAVRKVIRHARLLTRAPSASLLS